MTQPIWFTAKEVKEMSRLCERTLRRMRKRGEGPPFKKVGGRIYYPIDSFFEWARKADQLRD